MASQDTDDKEPEDLLETFKAKVEDALSLLPRIPNALRKETWTYWTVVSAAVKTALGGRGPVVPGTHRRYGAPSGRPRGRPPLKEQHRPTGRLQELSAGVNHGNISTTEDQVGSGLGAELDSVSNSHINCIPPELIPPVTYQETVESVAEVNAVSGDFEDLQTAMPASSCAPPGKSVLGAGGTPHLPHQVILKVCHGEKASGVSSHFPQEGNTVSVPLSSSALESSCNDSYNQHTGTKNVCLVPLAAMTSSCVPTAEPVKRKRGRPSKNSSSGGEKIVLQSLTSSEVILSESASETPVCPSLSERDFNHEQSDVLSKAQKLDMENGQQVPVVVNSRPKNNLTKDLNFVITALEQEIAKDTAQSFVDTSNSDLNSQLSAKVRRSERKTALNRDKVYYYFDQIKPEEEEADTEGPGANEGSQDKTVSVSQVSRGPRAKTEEEKIKECTCPVCKTILGCSSSMAAHMRIHTGERPFACQICKKQFTTKANCERHEATHLGIKAFACPQCNKNFTEKKSLKIHMRSHTGERPYVCSICGMRFFQTGTLKTHMDRHTGHKGHLCDLCGKAFRQRCQLAIHVRRHKKDMSFSCQHCNMLFYTKSDLERHLPKHTGERRFACTICPRTFTRLQYLREHMNMHLGHRPYECSACGMSFHDLASCHRHVQKHKQNIELQAELGLAKPEQHLGSKVQVIIDKQSFGLDTTDLQTLIVSSEPNTFQQYLQQDLTTTATTPSAAATIANHNNQSVAQAIFNNICLHAMDNEEIYHVTLVDPAASSVQVASDNTVEQNGEGVDFSAINLLASATTQLP